MKAQLAGLLLGALVVVGCDDPAPPSDEPSSPPAPPSAAPAGHELPADAIRGTLVFSSETSALEDVWALDLTDPEGPPIRLTEEPVREFDPDLSPDGELIVYRVNPEATGDEADLWLMAANGAAPRNLTNAPELNNWSPAWSPDGSRIAFASTRDGGTLRVWTMDPGGFAVRPVTTGHGEYPDWSPDGERIVYATPTGGRYDLWIIDSVGVGSPQQLTDTTTTEFAPAWSPDGEWIAFQLDMGSRFELWIIRPDGTDAHRVSPEGEDGVWPAWSPDGLLAWSGTRGLSFLDVARGASRSFEPAQPGTDFLSWGR